VATREKYRLELNNVPDERLREQLEVVDDFLVENPYARFKGRVFELTFTAAATNYRVLHNLKRTPKDAWMTYITPDSGGVWITFNWDEFDTEYFDVTVNGACTVRVMVGYFEEPRS